jgi:hypothetical protein
MPLLAELSNCLSAYQATFERIMSHYSHVNDLAQTHHDPPVIIQVQDLLAIDTELKRNVQKMAAWKERQDRIDELEAKLNGLTTRINSFAKTLSATHIALQNCVGVAARMRRGVSNQNNVTVRTILQTAQTIAPAASGARRTDQTFPWMPSIPQMQNGALVVEGVDVAVPTVAAHSVPLEPVQTSRTPVLPGQSDGSTSSEGE